MASAARILGGELSRANWDPANRNSYTKDAKVAKFSLCSLGDLGVKISLSVSSVCSVGHLSFVRFRGPGRPRSNKELEPRRPRRGFGDAELDAEGAESAEGIGRRILHQGRKGREGDLSNPVSAFAPLATFV